MLNFFLVVLLALTPNVILAYFCKDLPFFLPNNLTDNEKMLKAAKNLNILGWPSKMHAIENNRSQSREYWTIICSILIKLIKNQKNDFVTICLGLLSNSASTILIYFIFTNYFDQTIGLIACLLYVTSFWSYHICLFIGHVVLAQLFFLVSILFLQFANLQINGLEYLFFFLSGIFMMISFASSSASLKYPPLIIFALLFTIKNEISVNFNFFEFDILLILIPLFYFVLVFYSFSHVKEKLILKKLKIYLFLISTLILFFLLSLSITFDAQLKILSFSLGATTIFLHLTMPLKDLFKNIKRIVVWRSSLQVSHFLAYPKFIQDKIFNSILDKNFRGGGVYWNFKVFFTFMPFIFPIYLLSVIIYFFIALNELFYNGNTKFILYFLAFFFLSSLPTIIHETTKGLKVAKAYFATFLTYLIFPFIFLYNIKFSYINDLNYEIILYLLYFVSFLQLIHSFIVVRENLVSRVFVKNLFKFLSEQKISEFNTYDNKYNKCFVENMTYSYQNNFKINFIKNINELKNSKNKILVVPPITSKVLYFNTDYNAAIDEYFRDDLELLKIIKNKKIETFALKKLKTMSSYPYYIYDDEVLSYRSIYLKQINSDDRFKGYGWVLDLKSLWI